MTWKRLNNGDWQAMGDKGDFLVWKIRRGFYKARYRSKDKKLRFELPGGDIERVKKCCEENFYWE